MSCDDNHNKRTKSITLTLNSLLIECNSKITLTVQNDVNELLSLCDSQECHLWNINWTMLGFAKCNGIDNIPTGGFIDFNNYDGDDG